MSIPRFRFIQLLAPIVAGALVVDCDAEPLTVVASGKAVNARYTGSPWESGTDGLGAEGTGRLLLAKSGVGSGDFRIRAKLTLARTDGSAASFFLDGSHFGFDGRSGGMFFEGPLFDGVHTKGAASIKAASPFELAVERKSGTTRFLIDNREILRKDNWNSPISRIGFRPHRNRISIAEFEIDGTLIKPPHPPTPLFLSGFAGGSDGYHTFRIPSLAVTTKGTILAFCEGRKNSSGDSGDIDLVMKRSTDHGRSWSGLQVVWSDGINCCGNPCVVVDKSAGVIFMLSAWNRGDDHEGGIIAGKSKDTRRVFLQQSVDDGATWSKPVEITRTTKKPDWTWYATGPGSGIQIEQGPHKGRLVIPCDHIEAGTKRYFSHVIFSDDHGKSWQLGGRTPEPAVNECQVVELSGGKLMLNMRNYNRASRARQTAVSTDGGLTWIHQKHDAILVEPICQASIERFAGNRNDNSGTVIFANPANSASRVNLTIRASLDDAETWPFSKVLWSGPSGYSDLAELSNGDIACLFEAGSENIAESIVFQNLPFTDLRAASAGSEKGQ